jgi:hypothetical protein
LVPTLAGRIQTRLFLLATVGLALTALLVALPQIDAGAFLVLLWVAVLGVGWELVYHLIMQFRWEKDWPTLFGLVTLIPEGLLLYVLLRSGVIGPAPTAGAFWTHFVMVWMGVWLVGNGPMRVPFIRWRFRGGRVL